MENSRRRQRVGDSMEVISTRQYAAMDRAAEQELARQEKKNRRREEIEMSSSYSMIKGIKTILDDWYVDAIVGLVIPGGIGDALSGSLSLPYLYISMFKVRSFSLTLAVLYNMLLDVILGMIPFYVGDVIDFFNKSFKRNYRLIVGFVEDDQETIRQVKRRAVYCFFMILVFIGLIYLLFVLGAMLINWIRGLIGW